MAPSIIHKAIGAMKDQMNISIAKVAGNIASELEVFVVKATSHDEDPADEKYCREIINLTSYSRGYITACIVTVSKRPSKTHDWIVALKSLMLVHRILDDGSSGFEEEIVFSTRRGTRVLNMSDFQDKAHSNSWDHAGFVRFYAMYLDEKVEFLVFKKKGRDGEEKFIEGDERNRVEYRDFRDHYDWGIYNRSRSYIDLKATQIREMRLKIVLGRLHKFLKILDIVLGCRPSGIRAGPDYF